MDKKKCKVYVTLRATAWVDYNEKGEEQDFNDLIDILSVEDYEVISVID